MLLERSLLQHRGHGVRHSSNPYSADPPNCQTSSISSNSSVDSLAAEAQSPSDSPKFSIPGIVIPNVKNWCNVVQQWEIGDVSTMALKDWPKEWYQGGMKRFTGSLYSQRKTIAKEYEWHMISWWLTCTSEGWKHNLISLGCDDECLCKTYLVANKSMKALLNAIRVAHNKWCVSKRGMPEERDNSEEREHSLYESDAWILVNIQ